MDYLFFQQYWWVIISFLGAMLVLLMFVQGGQTLVYTLGKTETQRTMLINTTGRKWEFTFTTLVVFGGSMFAAFPLFYSVSFGGAYWVWMLLLFSFVIQAISYEYRTKPSNFLGKKTYEKFLLINGVVATVVVGVAVGTFYNGANFSLNEYNQSEWATGWYGLKALLNVHNLALGASVLFLSRTLGLLYFVKTIDEDHIVDRARTNLLYNAIPFLVAFLYFLITLLVKDGYTYDPTTSVVSLEAYKYLHNLLEMPVVLASLLLGVVGVLFGIYTGILSKSLDGIWYTGVGSFLVVFALLLIAGLNNTCFYPSLVDMQSSLNIQNSSSSFYTLKIMGVVSLIIPFVIAYIWYMWRAISNKPMDEKELDTDSHIY
jgi:cytochrome d ubiquinol oxidase subunit II